MFRRGGYGEMMKGRFGFVPVKPKPVGVRRIWVQAVSVGELLAIEGLLERLSEFEGTEVILSTTTSTGYQLAKQKYGSLVEAVVSFPLDFWGCVNVAWNRIGPDLCVITEAEIWPEHVYTAHSREIPLLLINARLSDKSYQRMRSAQWLQPLFYEKISGIGASSELDAGRILDLGYSQDRMLVTGNLKFDVGESSKLDEQQRCQLGGEIWKSLVEADTSFTLIGASTWAGEEKILIESALELRSSAIPLKLLITPRHAERRAEIRNLLESYGDAVSWEFRSDPEWRFSSSEQSALRVYVADTTGELKRLLQIADVAVIGRSFPPHTEGQTPIEAAAFGIPVVYGPSLSNFRAICRALEKAEGSIRVDPPERLTAVLRELLENEPKRKSLCDASNKVFQESRGSTERTVEMIRSHF